MALKVSCPGCGTSYQLNDAAAGRKIRCSTCQQVFRAGPRIERPAPRPPIIDEPEPEPVRHAEIPVLEVASDSPEPLQDTSRDDRPKRGGRDRPKRRRVKLEKPSVLPWLSLGLVGLLIYHWKYRDYEDQPGLRGQLSRSVAATMVIGSMAAAVLLVAGVGAALFLINKAENPNRGLEQADSNTKLPAPPQLANAAIRQPVAEPEPASTMDGSIPLQTLQQIKDATVFVKLDNSSGSGFVISADGETALVVTNQHVVKPSFTYEPPAARVGPGSRFRGPAIPRAMVVTEKNVRVNVVFGSGTAAEHSHPAEIIASDEEHDLAILKVNGVQSLPKPIDFMQDPKLVETMPVYSFGFPFGQALAGNKSNPAITVGKATVSSIRLDNSGDLAVVQIDGALNPGNSGGPIVDVRGRLVGVAVAIIRGANNIGLAVPAQQLAQLVRGGIGSIELKVVSQTSEHMEIEFNAQLIDLWKRINNASIYYRTGPPPAGTTRESFARQSDTQTVPLKLEQGKATGRFTIMSRNSPSLNIVCQVALNDNEGKTTLTGMTTRNLRGAPTVADAGMPEGRAVVKPPVQASRGGWKEYTPSDNSFKVQIPDGPGRRSEQIRDMTINGMQFKLSLVQFTANGTPLFNAGTVTLPAQAARQLSMEKTLDLFREGIVRELGGRIQTTQAAQQYNMTGKELQFQSSNGLIRMRILGSPGHILIASVTGTQDQLNGSPAIYFLDSLRQADDPAPNRAPPTITTSPNQSAPTPPKSRQPLPRLGPRR